MALWLNTVEGKPVSKKVLELILGLTGFERGAVFLADTENDFKLKLRLGSFKDIKAVMILCRRILDVRPNEFESVADLRRCRWVRNYQELRGTEILSYAYILLLNEYTLAGFPIWIARSWLSLILTLKGISSDAFPNL